MNNNCEKFISNVKMVSPPSGLKSRVLSAVRDSVVNIPLVGDVACGKPVFANEDIERYIPYDRNMVKGDVKNFYFLRAKGTSMDKENISEGDFVLIRNDVVPEIGDKVVALIGDEATIKIYNRNKEGVVLEPRSNDPSHETIVLTEDTICQGKVIDIIKNK